MLRIVVCVATYRRPLLLAELLRRLAQLSVPDGADTSFLVIDNDPARSAAGVVGDFMAGRPLLQGALMRVEYEAEPATGLANVRNRALDEARLRGADRLCFIDDDEWPEPQWLMSLLACQEKTGAVLVGGPTELGPLPAGATLWQRFLYRGMAKEKRRRTKRCQGRASKHEAVALGTDNWMCDLHFVTARGLRFDTVFNTSGGEDSDFYERMCAIGGRTAWTAQARVIEVPALDRINLRHQFRRRRVQSATLYRQKRARGEISSPLYAWSGAVGRMTLGALTCLTLFAVPSYLISGVRSLGWATGRIDGMLGTQSTLYGAEAGDAASVASPVSAQ